MKTTCRKLVASALCFVFLASMLGISCVASATPEKIGSNKKAEIKEETGSTDAFGGGDYAFVRFGADAYFGVLWGNATNPNSIMMLVVHTRYLGTSDVYDSTGAKIAKNFPIKVYTVYGVKLLDMFEFNDTNGDGICNGIRVSDGLEYRDYIVHEPIYKGVSLTSSWTRSDITKSENETSKSYEFSLTANNLPYKAIGNSSSIKGDVATKTLDKLQFTFHLSASLVNVENVPVPHYKVTVEKSDGRGYDIVSSERLADLNYTGKRGSYNVKWDQLIEGWDFDQYNVNKSLLLEWHGLTAYFIPEKVGEWLNAQFMKRTGGEGQAIYEDQNGQLQTATGSDPATLLPRKVRPGKYLDFGGNWTKIGRFRWTSDCTVDGKPGTMYAQVQGGRPFSITGDAGNHLVGFAVLGGFSYPGGTTIFHDPGIDGAVLMDVEPSRFPFLLVGGLFLLVVVIIAVAFYMRSGRKKEGFESSYDRNEKNHKGEDWSDYYEKK